MSNDLVKCTRCKKDKNIIHFMKMDRQLKLCEDCRIYHKKNKIKNFCDCGKAKHFCEKHGGSCLCPCGKRKERCILHSKERYCKCGVQKISCKTHGDTRKIIINNMLYTTRMFDKQKKKFDKNQFIDKQFLSNLLNLYENCFYCNCKLNFDKKNPNLATIERLDNSLGHIKRNCVIACFKCNVSRVGDKYN